QLRRHQRNESRAAQRAVWIEVLLLILSVTCDVPPRADRPSSRRALASRHHADNRQQCGCTANTSGSVALTSNKRPKSSARELVGCHRPRRCITKPFDEWRKTCEIAVLRDQGDALLAARRGDQCIIQQRSLFVEQLPAFLRADRCEDTATLGEGRAGRRE